MRTSTPQTPRLLTTVSDDWSCNKRWVSESDKQQEKQ